MKRGAALERRTPLERETRLQATQWGTRPKPKKASWRDEFLPTWFSVPDEPKLTEFDRKYLAWIRTLECRALRIQGHVCRGRMTAHHAGKKPGMSMLAPTNTAIPLCWLAHLEGIEILGDVFKGWTRDEVRAWEDGEVRQVRLLARPDNLDQALALQEAGLGIAERDASGALVAWVPLSDSEAA